MLVKGNNLSSELRAQVLNMFVYRWTRENPHRERAYKTIGGPRTPLQTDVEWLATHAFHVTKTGRIDARYKGCFPV